MLRRGCQSRQGQSAECCHSPPRMHWPHSVVSLWSRSLWNQNPLAWKNNQKATSPQSISWRWLRSRTCSRARNVGQGRWMMYLPGVSLRQSVEGPHADGQRLTQSICQRQHLKRMSLSPRHLLQHLQLSLNRRSALQKRYFMENDTR